MNNGKKNRLTVIDLFAGAGGFSCGLANTGVFDIVMAVEVHPQYRKTFEINHPGVPVLGDINQVINDSKFYEMVQRLQQRHGNIDLIVGGPPCQGFSTANRQRNHLISTNNLLVTSFMKFVAMVGPKAFVMENVSGMPGYDFYVSTDEWEEQALALSGVSLSSDTVTLGKVGQDASALCDFLNLHLRHRTLRGLPGSDFVEKLNPVVRLIKNHFIRGRHDEGYRVIQRRQRELRNAQLALADTDVLPTFIKAPLLSFLGDVEKHGTVDLGKLSLVASQLDILARAQEIQVNGIKVFGLETQESRIVAHLKSYNLASHLEEYFRATGYAVQCGILQAADFAVPQRRDRVIFMGVKKELIGDGKLELPSPVICDEEQYYSVSDAIADLTLVDPVTDVTEGPLLRELPTDAPPLAQHLMGNSREIHNHIRTDTREAAQKRFQALKPGQNFHDLPPELMQTYSDPSRTQLNIYRRLEWESPAPTVTNVRKAMWVHPQIDRAISVREAARLQSFPDSYRFVGPKNDQYQQVGNAVPPFLGQAIGESIARILGAEPVTSLADIIKVHPKSKAGTS